MSYLNLPSKPTLDRERSEVLQQWENWLEMPMLVLSFAWLGLFIVELVWGLNSLLEAIGTTIWIVFIVDFGIKFILLFSENSGRAGTMFFTGVICDRGMWLCDSNVSNILCRSGCRR
jgi:hypothetical protein